MKVALLHASSCDVIATGVADQGIEQDACAISLLERLLAENGSSRQDLRQVVATGYARDIISIADSTVTEITCHARGIHHTVPEARTVIEIGGQDSKLLRLGPDGRVRDFAMNDRCAAGTGRFLEMVATRLGVTLSDLGAMAGASSRPVVISSMCVVFAETEIIGLLASRTPKEDIVAGVEQSIASRVAAMIGRKVDPPVVLTGGVALVPGMDKALSQVIEHPVSIAPDPQMSGALGAALIAADTCQ